MRSLVEMLSGRPAVSLVIHRSQLLWRVSSLDSWVLDKAHDSAVLSTPGFLHAAVSSPVLCTWGFLTKCSTLWYSASTPALGLLLVVVVRAATIRSQWQVGRPYRVLAPGVPPADQ